MEERCTQDQQFVLQSTDESKGHGTSHHHKGNGSLTAIAFMRPLVLRCKILSNFVVKRKEHMRSNSEILIATSRLALQP